MVPGADDKRAHQTFQDEKLVQLAQAGCLGDRAEVAKLVQGGVPVDGPGVNGVTPLRWVVDCDNVDGADALIAAGANPNRRTGNDTPVLAAARHRNPRLLRLLLQHGGDPDATDGEGNDSALYYALGLGVEFDEWENYYLLLNAGADINRSINGSTVADRAVALGRPSKVIELIERGYRQDLDRLARLVKARGIAPGREAEAQVRLAKILGDLQPD